LFPGVALHPVDTLGQAYILLEEYRYWLAIIDINLPDGSGIDLIRDIAKRHPDTLCIVSTIFDDDHHIFSALRSGAQGYLVKDQPRDQQLRQLKEILHGQPPLSPGVARRVLRHLSEQVDKSIPPDERLTERETEVLRLIAKGFSRPEVARMLGLSLNTVATYTKSIYQKLEISGRAEAAVEAVRLGLV